MQGTEIGSTKCYYRKCREFSNMEGFPTKEAALEVGFQKDPVLIDIDGRKTRIDLNRAPEIFELADDNHIKDQGVVVPDGNKEPAIGLTHASGFKLCYTEEHNEGNSGCSGIGRSIGDNDLRIRGTNGTHVAAAELGISPELGNKVMMFDLNQSITDLETNSVDQVHNLLPPPGDGSASSQGKLELGAARKGKKPIIVEEGTERLQHFTPQSWQHRVGAHEIVEELLSAWRSRQGKGGSEKAKGVTKPMPKKKAEGVPKSKPSPNVKGRKRRVKKKLESPLPVSTGKGPGGDYIILDSSGSDSSQGQRERQIGGSKEEICGVSKNPAEFHVPKVREAFTINWGDLKPRSEGRKRKRI